jgi:carbon starvation protein
VIALFGTFMIMVIILAVLALIVVKALAESPWGMFTVAATIPIALLMGVYSRYIRPGRIGEMSIIGFVLLMASIIYGGDIAASETWGPLFTFDGKQLTWLLIGYGFIASVLPVWLLLAPRDYLSTFLKIGTIVGLAIGIAIVAPTCRCRPSPSSSTAPARCGPAACSPSCSSPSPAAPCPASMR